MKLKALQARAKSHLLPRTKARHHPSATPHVRVCAEKLAPMAVVYRDTWELPARVSRWPLQDAPSRPLNNCTSARACVLYRCTLPIQIGRRLLIVVLIEKGRMNDLISEEGWKNLTVVHFQKHVIDIFMLFNVQTKSTNIAIVYWRVFCEFLDTIYRAF